MLMSNRFILAGATFLVALGIGAIMQWGGLPTQLAERGVAPTGDDVADGSGPAGNGPRALRAPDMADAPSLSGITFTSAPPVPREAMPPLEVPGRPEKVVAPRPDEAPVIDRPVREESAVSAPDCQIGFGATSAGSGVVRLDIEAPCLPGERVTLHHNGLMATAVTDDTGALSLDVPAFAPAAVFIAAFANGEGAVAQTRVDGIEDRARVALQWRGDAAIALHARENGARYGEEGHIHADRAGEPGSDGFLMRLAGDTMPAPLGAEVYTFPKGVRPGDPSVLVTIEVEVTEANCGKDLDAQLLVRRDGALEARDIALFMPACSAVGDFLVLKNPFADLKLARND